MPTPNAAAEALDREFLTLRSKLIDVAAILDRLDRAEGDGQADPRRRQIAESLAILASSAADRAERIQMAFSLPYDPNWRG